MSNIERKFNNSNCAPKDKLYPFEISEVDGKVKDKYPEYKHDEFIFVGPKNYCFLKAFRDVLPELYNFQIRPDDVWVFGYPRSGTTLAREIIWLIGNDLNYEKAAAEIIDVRFPYFDVVGVTAKERENVNKNLKSYNQRLVNIVQKLKQPAWETLPQTTERRFIKTHIPLSLASPDLLRSKCKIIYLARNPKDVCVSHYNLRNSFVSTKEPIAFENYWNYFRDGLNNYLPHFEHVKEGWELRSNNNFLFLFYEEITKDLRKSLITIADFLDKKLTDGELDKLEDHVKFENFKKNDSVNNSFLKEMGVFKDDNFIRKGKTGGWKDYFTGKLNAEADEWIKENSKNTDLKFSYY